MNVRWMYDQFGLFFMLDLFDKLDIFGFFAEGFSIKLESFGMKEWQRALVSNSRVREWMNE